MNIVFIIKLWLNCCPLHPMRLLQHYKILEFFLSKMEDFRISEMKSCLGKAIFYLFILSNFSMELNTIPLYVSISPVFKSQVFTFQLIILFMYILIILLYHKFCLPSHLTWLINSPITNVQLWHYTVC